MAGPMQGPGRSSYAAGAPTFRAYRAQKVLPALPVVRQHCEAAYPHRVMDSAEGTKDTHRDVRWIHGSPPGQHVSEPQFQAHPYDPHTYLLRQMTPRRPWAIR